MNTGIQRESAEILQFPPPGLRHRGDRKAHANATTIKVDAEVYDAASFGSWYHEAAIHEADRSRKP